MIVPKKCLVDKHTKVNIHNVVGKGATARETIKSSVFLPILELTMHVFFSRPIGFAFSFIWQIKK